MPTPDVTVVTATTARPERMRWLSLLHASLQASNVDWEWSVAVDGATPEQLPSAVLEDSRVLVTALPRRSGAAAARNIALQQATAPWVTSADDDDVLPPDSLRLRLQAVQRDPAVQWSAGLLADLHADGRVVTWDCPSPRGRVRAGDVWRSWSSPTAMIPLGPTTLLVAADLLRRVGGWQGLPQGEDLGMVCAVTGVADGVVLDDVVYHYRKHPGQMMREPGFGQLEQTAREVTWRRGQLLAAHT